MENQYDFIGSSVINQYGTVQFECENRKEAELAAGRMNTLLGEISRLKQDKLDLLVAVGEFANRRDMQMYCVPLAEEMKEFVEDELKEMK